MKKQIHTYSTDYHKPAEYAENERSYVHVKNQALHGYIPERLIKSYVFILLPSAINVPSTCCSGFGCSFSSITSDELLEQAIKAKRAKNKIPSLIWTYLTWSVRKSTDLKKISSILSEVFELTLWS